MEQPDHAAAVRQLLYQARQAVAASRADQALQSVIQALRLLQGNEGVLPALRAAAEQYHYTQAPIDDLSRLLSQVTLAAEAQEKHGAAPQMQQQQHQQQHEAPWQQHPQHGAMPAAGGAGLPGLFQQQLQQDLQEHAMGEAGQQQHEQYQQYQQQQQYQHYEQPLGQVAGHDKPILEETGRGSFTDAALADGSSWRCPHCAGVVPLQRQQAHLSHWCPQLNAAMP